MSSYGIYLSGLAALGQSAKIDVAANNLANLSTPGFRGDRLTFRERLVEALEDRPDFQYYNALVDRHGGAPFIDSMRFDTQPGAFEQTHRKLDFALSGDGYFNVRNLNSGAVTYTRAGNFSLDPAGRLLTSDGKYQVLRSDGGGIEIDPEGSPDIVLKEDGTLLQGDSQIGVLAITAFDDLSKLEKRGDTMFVNRGSAEAAPSRLHAVQGVLEKSSVNPVGEMVRMIRALRALESNLEMIRFQDQTLQKSVNDLGRVQQR